MDEPWKHYSSWKKLDTKGHILYDSESEKWKSLSCVRLYTIHVILQAKILEWVAFPFSKGSSQSRDQTQVSRIVGRFFTS